MVKCNCGKEIAAVPNWLADVKVNFVCNNCPNRELPGITQVNLGLPKEEELVLAPIKSTMPEAEAETDDDDEVELEPEAEAEA